ncbi:MAG: Ig-like domain-containing protein [Lachnospiraceae bacterium]|nr:Ig-like domain-containing protein [Lachnospiraceae bacterium]
MGRHKKDDLDFIELDDEYYGDEEIDEEYYGAESVDEDEEYYELEDVDDGEEYYESEEADEEEYYRSEEIEEYYEPEGAEDDEVYFESEEAETVEEYYELEESETGEEYYKLEEPEDDKAYYESEEPEADDEYYEEYYEPAESDEEYYELEEAGDGIEYYELDEETDEEYYESVEDWEEADEEEGYYAEEEEYAGVKEGILSRIADFLSGLNTMDYLIAGTGVLVLIFAIAAGSMFIGSRISAGQVEAFAELGSDLEKIDIIGESGLLAVADAAKGKQEAAQLVGEGAEGEIPEQTENEAPAGSIEVGMNLSSMQQDLKIKFINKKSTKLIASVPFEVEVTDVNKKTYTLTDDDMDGIIYKSGLTPGKYSVSMVKLSGESYQEYAFSSDAQQVTVKDKIEYKKVDVSDEIKTEAQVNASAEDTKVKETVESSNKDTVAFVESTRTELGDGSYKEINKATITDPSTSAGALQTGAFLRLSNIATNEVSIKRGESVGVNTSLTGDVITWLSDNELVASVDGAMTGSMNVITGKKGGTATVTASNSVDVETFQVTVTETQFTLDKTSISLDVGKTETITASVPVTWTSDDPSVAAVDENGVVTGVKDGTTSIVARAQDGAAMTCSVKVSSVSTTISPTEISIKVGETTVPEITVNGPDKTVVWTTTDATVATVALNGTITGVKEGKATITATANGVSASCQVTVTGKDGSAPNPPNANAAEDTTTALKDNRGNQVYIMNASGEYVAAVYADYYKYDKFYIKSAAYKYTGWQTIDGSVYYYDINGNVVTGTQVIQGATYNFDSVTGALVTSSGILGIDVSKWNGNIDWNAVKNSGIHYVIIRCGYRGSSTGALIEDPKFRANIKGATAAGLKVGIYFFTQAVNEVEAVEEASMVLSLISGYTISYPVFLDVEPSGGRADGIGTDTRTAVCNAFCQTISNSGYAAGIYANKTWLNEKINVGGIGASYKVWLAQYAATPSYGGKYQMWQYTSKGKVAGIQGDVDMNLSYLGY